MFKYNRGIFLNDNGDNLRPNRTALPIVERSEIRTPRDAREENKDNCGTEK